MIFLKKNNNARTSLSSSLNGTDLSFTVLDASTFPASGSFLITLWDLSTYTDPIDDPNLEILKVTGVSSNTFTVLRGQENTTAHSHVSSSTVEMLITAGHFEEIEAGINLCVPTSRTISASNGLSGGGDLSADRTISGINAAADGSTKGVSAFNATNFSASSGIINTIQNIHTGATPSFAGLTLTGNLTLSTHNIVTDTTTGSIIATSTSQKLGFWGSTAIVKPSGNILTALSNMGLIANPFILGRVVVMPDATSFTPSGDTGDQFTQANTQSLGVLTANAPSGTPVNGQKILIRIKSSNVQNFSWNTIYRSTDTATLPASTTAGECLYIEFVYNSTDTKWDCINSSRISGLTPWTSNIDANGFSLNYVNELTVNGLSTFNDNVDISGTSTLYIGTDAIAWINSPGGDGVELVVHANSQLTLSASTSGVVWVDGVYFGINTAVPRGIFDINNYTNLTVEAPSGATAFIQYGSGDYFNEEYSSQFRIYSYKDTVGGRIFSSTYSETAIVTDNALADSQYYIQLTWTASGDADGYVVVVADGYNGYSFDYQYILDGNGTTSSDYMSVDYANDNTVVTPTSYHSGPDLYVASDDGSVNLSGNFNIYGAITQTNSDIENTFSGPVKIVADHAYTGAGNDGILWVVSTNSSISATFRLEGSTNPKMLWGNTSATTNQKYVQIYLDGSGSLNWGNLNDALSLESSFMKFTRSGINPQYVLFDSGNIGANVGIGVSTPSSARLQIAAGSTSKYAIKLTSASLPTGGNIIAGGIAFLTDKYYGTITTGTAIKEFTMNDGTLTSGRVPFATTNGRLIDDSDFTFATDTLTVTKIAATTFTGDITLSTKNIITDTTTGTKFGTATSQKIAFYNSTPIVQPTGSIKTALSNLGLVASPTITLSSDVTGTLPVANGGTGQTTSYRLFSHFTDVNNSGTGETDLYTDTITAGKLATNGDTILALFGGIFTGAAAATQQIKVYFGGTVIYDSGALSIGIATNNWTVNVAVVRVSSSVVRCDVFVNSDFATLFPYSKYTEVTSLTLANTQVIKITGTAAGAGGASNQVTAKLGFVDYEPI